MDLTVSAYLLLTALNTACENDGEMKEHKPATCSVEYSCSRRNVTSRGELDGSLWNLILPQAIATHIDPWNRAGPSRATAKGRAEYLASEMNETREHLVH
jgi:hypothetical protein